MLLDFISVDMYITTGDKKYILQVHVGLLCMAISSPLPLFLQKNNIFSLEMEHINQVEFYIIRDFSTAW